MFGFWLAVAIFVPQDRASPSLAEFHQMGERWAQRGLDTDACLQSFVPTMEGTLDLSVQEDRQTIHRKAQVHAGLAMWMNGVARREMRVSDELIASLEPQFRRGDISASERDEQMAEAQRRKAEFERLSIVVSDEYPECRFDQLFSPYAGLF